MLSERFGVAVIPTEWHWGSASIPEAGFGLELPILKRGKIHDAETRLAEDIPPHRAEGSTQTKPQLSAARETGADHNKNVV